MYILRAQANGITACSLPPAIRTLQGIKPALSFFPCVYAVVCRIKDFAVNAAASWTNCSSHLLTVCVLSSSCRLKSKGITPLPAR